VLKDIIQVYNTSLGEMTGYPIELVSTGKGMFPEKIKSKSCKWVRWIRDVLTRGAMKVGKCKALPVGAFVEGELHLSWMQLFPSPFMLFNSYFFIVFFFQETNQGTLPGTVTSGGSVTHKYFHRNEKVGS
jgi:hypothetical protein